MLTIGFGAGKEGYVVATGITGCGVVGTANVGCATKGLGNGYGYADG